MSGECLASRTVLRRAVITLTAIRYVHANLQLGMQTADVAKLTGDATTALGGSIAGNGRKSESRRAALQRAFKSIRAYEESLSLEMLRGVSASDSRGQGLLRVSASGYDDRQNNARRSTAVCVDRYVCRPHSCRSGLEVTRVQVA